MTGRCWRFLRRRAARATARPIPRFPLIFAWERGIECAFFERAEREEAEKLSWPMLRPFDFLRAPTPFEAERFEPTLREPALRELRPAVDFTPVELFVP